MSTLTDRPHTALLVIDVQNGVVDGAHDRDLVVGNIASLVDRERAGDVPVVWVQHNAEDLPVGSEEWRYVKELPLLVTGGPSESQTGTVSVCPSRSPSACQTSSWPTSTVS